MVNIAAYERKLTTFRKMMQSLVPVSTIPLIQDPMYPTDPTKKIPSGIAVIKNKRVRLVRSRSVDENYIENSAGFIPETFKWILSLDEIQEGSSFQLHGDTYFTGKPESLMFQGRVYGYRSPVNVRSS